jgi:hypothetical protein
MARDTTHLDAFLGADGSWKEHHVLQADGERGHVSRPAKFRFVPQFNQFTVVPFGLSKMDNGEILLLGASKTDREKFQNGEETVAAISGDGGATWSDYQAIGYGRPVMTTYLGGGTVCYCDGGLMVEQGTSLCFSHDYGRTWKERIKLQPTPDAKDFCAEGSPLVDYDDQGKAALIGWTGQTFPDNFSFDKPITGCVRWSSDGGRTWDNFSAPDAWVWQDEHEGKTYDRGCGEGAMVRAGNGSIVAALRSDMLMKYVPYHYDNFEGVAISSSKDEGKTWSKVKHVLEAGQMHANLVRLPNDDLVMTVIRRLDIRGGKQASYRRGCDAVVSRDHGETWEVDRMYVLDDWPHHRPDQWYEVACGHLFSVSLGDGSVLTAYGHYQFGGAMIKWRP